MITCSPIMDDIDSIIEHDISSSDVEQLGGVIHNRDELTSPNDDSECEDVNPMSDISTGPCVNSVAVAGGARLSCGVFMVYSVLLSVSLVAHAPI